MTRDVSRCHWVLCHLDTLSCWHGQWQVWHIRWLGSSLTFLSPLQSAVTCSSVIWTHLFVWYLDSNDSILRASNAILRVTEQAWRDGQKLSDINISAVCRVLSKTYFFIWSPRCAAVTDVYLWAPLVMSISDFCLDFPLVWISWGAEATLLYFRRSYTTSHMYHSKSKERNLVQETFMKRIKIHFFFIGSIQFLKLTSQPRIASMGHSRLTRLTEYAKSNYNLTRVLE